MFGQNILVSPVYKYDNTTNIYFPIKYNWYCFWSAKYIKGGTYMKNMTVPLNQIPLFIFEGSIIIMADYMQYTLEKYPWIQLEIRIYPGKNGSNILYNDNGKDKYSGENFIKRSFI